VSSVRRHQLVAYFALAFVASWAIWAPAVVLSRGAIDPRASAYFHLAGSLGPMFSALVVTRVVGGAPSKRRPTSPRRARPSIAGSLAPAAGPPLRPCPAPSCALCLLAGRCPGPKPLPPKPLLRQHTRGRRIYGGAHRRCPGLLAPRCGRPARLSRRRTAERDVSRKLPTH
jgi:hypothetical protein